MTKEEFMGLPAALALGTLYDIARAKLEPLEAPRVPYPPKYDGRLNRKNRQFCYMSEMELESLIYWHQAYLDKDPGDEYAEKNAKTAKELGYWVEWRKCFPTAAWTGERNREKVTALPPSREPALHDWEARGAAPAAAAPRRDRSFGDGSGSNPGPSRKSFDADDDDLPF